MPLIKMVSGLLATLASLVRRKPKAAGAPAPTMTWTMVAAPDGDTPGPTLNDIHSAFIDIEMQHGVRPEKVLVDAECYLNLARRCRRDGVPMTRMAAAGDGSATMLWGAEVVVSRDVAPGTFHVQAGRGLELVFGARTDEREWSVTVAGEGRGRVVRVAVGGLAFDVDGRWAAKVARFLADPVRVIVFEDTSGEGHSMAMLGKGRVSVSLFRVRGQAVMSRDTAGSIAEAMLKAM